ncbi:unnamed protein product [Thelazia callipaeda]|uniref:Kazal-like domain-containing protein n=1 Tax=Thelazia callipaeda TaxID=103827 RepID=A0A0N5DAE4_THECL|nr:unnamed protein product [Thelazia callipaeda]
MIFETFYQIFGDCCQLDEHCGITWTPICDQQGNVYQNQCHFDKENCILNKKNSITLRPTDCRELGTPKIADYGN